MTEANRSADLRAVVVWQKNRRFVHGEKFKRFRLNVLLSTEHDPERHNGAFTYRNALKSYLVSLMHYCDDGSRFVKDFTVGRIAGSRLRKEWRPSGEAGKIEYDARVSSAVCIRWMGESLRSLAFMHFIASRNEIVNAPEFYHLWHGFGPKERFRQTAYEMQHGRPLFWHFSNIGFNYLGKDELHSAESPYYTDCCAHDKASRDIRASEQSIEDRIHSLLEKNRLVGQDPRKIAVELFDTNNEFKELTIRLASIFEREAEMLIDPKE